ncbi:MAG: DUF2007 domain-containing protein [Verrucomicrobiota bacterium]|jgi:hypothetical protein|nr:DUF2007 domain-containing protein [Verrucomicrobiota bacterium]MEE2715366.1 DUF2007 domain-containing protein [Verrucomicrobiota bacterium]MEE2813162.1 DUF2007 domain-containing protein [Verrucomicrobiota bacterium]
MERVTVFTAFNPVQAQIIGTRLQAAGLDATVEGEAAALSIEGYSLATGGVRVQVPSSQEADARELIESHEENES